MAASFANAQVQIIESQPIGGKPPSAARSAEPSNTAGQAEMFYQMQLLQQEVLELRGLVEQQSFEIRQLKQQRLDDYLDLDRRLSQIAAGAPAGPAAGPTRPDTSAPRSGDPPAWRSSISPASTAPRRSGPARRSGSRSKGSDSRRPAGACRRPRSG